MFIGEDFNISSLVSSMLYFSLCHMSLTHVFTIHCLRLQVLHNHINRNFGITAMLLSNKVSICTCDAELVVLTPQSTLLLYIIITSGVSRT